MKISDEGILSIRADDSSGRVRPEEEDQEAEGLACKALKQE